MRKKLNGQAFSNEDRIKAIEDVKDIISSSDGCIMNFGIFSDLALSLSIEIEENRIGPLHKGLSSILSMPVYNSQDINLKSNKEWLILMNVSFSNGKGELKQEIPKVPR